MGGLSKFTSHISFLWKWFKDMLQQNKKVNQKREKCGIQETDQSEEKCKVDLVWQLFTKSRAQMSSLQLVDCGIQKVGVWKENVNEQKNLQICYYLYEVGISSCEEGSKAGMRWGEETVEIPRNIQDYVKKIYNHMLCGWAVNNLYIVIML